jgi:hypothetical protein
MAAYEFYCLDQAEEGLIGILPSIHFISDTLGNTTSHKQKRREGRGETKSFPSLS